VTPLADPTWRDLAAAVRADPVKRRRLTRLAVHAAAGLLLLAALLYGVATLPDGPPDPRPAEQLGELSDAHGCVPARDWPLGDVAGGALIARTDPGRDPAVAWVPPWESARYEPDGWWLRQWCVQ
jgi:hypothetical protein